MSVMMHIYLIRAVYGSLKIFLNFYVTNIATWKFQIPFALKQLISRTTTNNKHHTDINETSSIGSIRLHYCFKGC